MMLEICNGCFARMYILLHSIDVGSSWLPVNRYIGKYGLKLMAKEPWYANGGFLGINRSDLQFLELWETIQDLMAPEIGGLEYSSLSGKKMDSIKMSYFYPFSKTDQDALNCAIELYESNISFMGKEAMGFVQGLACLPHSLGNPKPWNWPFFKMIFNEFSST